MSATARSAARGENRHARWPVIATTATAPAMLRNRDHRAQSIPASVSGPMTTIGQVGEWYGKNVPNEVTGPAPVSMFRPTPTYFAASVVMNRDGTTSSATAYQTTSPPATSRVARLRQGAVMAAIMRSGAGSASTPKRPKELPPR